ncbi:M20/M25/M40 family metallo-hydrolase [Solirubrobacter soli]|uniref:M20/M25/M40 family metallo-hydrolase n=1 Tax=Solirubrobacter soli TaxID=363832 RepID=UPI000403BF08|nr:M20/M25/M40 family metallo-hydrolase [Solirubrobacter soli]
MSDVVDLTRELVALNTVNPDLEPGAPGERPAVEHLAARLARNGFAIEIVGPRARPSLLATHRGTAADAPSLALNGHLDTVPAGGMRDAFTPRLEGDRLYGRGTCDMKAGVAALVVAAEHAARAGTRGDIVLALVADEEHGSLGTTAALARLTALAEAGAGGEAAGGVGRTGGAGLAGSEEAGGAAGAGDAGASDGGAGRASAGGAGAGGDGPPARGGRRLPAACIVAEPTWLELASAHRGFAVVEVEVRGRAAHSSRPQDGVNAVTHLARVLAGVEARDAQLRDAAPHPLAGHPSFMATVVSGGTAPFVLPDHARATIERRTVPGEPADAGKRDVEAILDAHPDIDATVTQTMAREAWQLDDEHPAVRHIVELLGAPARTGFPYWMESALWENAGIPAVVCGPAGGGLHTDVEWVEVPQLEAYTETLKTLIPEFTSR